MFHRLLLAALLIAAALCTGRASEVVPNEPGTGRSATVTQPHVTAELISEMTSLQIGQPFDVALHLHMDAGWHTYWINPGDAGLATTIKWALPAGIQSAGPIQWPTPEVHMMGPLTTYGYGGDVYLLTRMTPVSGWAGILPSKVEIKAHAAWLVCQEECIPGHADLTVTLDFKPAATPDPAHKAFFDALRARLPVENTVYRITSAAYGPEMDFNSLNGPPSLNLSLERDSAPPAGPATFRFFPEQPNVLATGEKAQGSLADPTGKMLSLWVRLAQNGEKPDHLSGVLIGSQPFWNESDKTPVGDRKAIAISFPVNGAPPAAVAAPSSGTPPAKEASAAPTEASTVAAPPAPVAPTLIAILGLAFLGGLILNLMPCVLPVLSLKVFSLIKHANSEKGGAWKQGVAFAAGVLVSFWILAGLLIVLESAGRHLGWGFQMQSPGFVLALIFLFFLLGLNLFGVFELGTSLVGVDVKASTHLGGLTSAFANGALATLAATPCTAPFMGSAVGFAAQQPAAISLLVFTALALGMAAPYLALTVFPGALRLVPKPGPWMEILKQFMGFLLMGTVIFLVYVFAALTGPDSVPMLLGALLVASLAAWIFGRANSPLREPATRIGWLLVALALLAAAIGEGIKLTNDKPPAPGAVAQDGWQPWSPAAVQQALAQGRPAFVDFTAAWCLSCKVNEEVALDIDSTKKLFAAKHVALFRGDWTQADPQISDTLRHFNRNGVPLYLVYSPKDPTTPQILPEVLTPELVQDVFQKSALHRGATMWWLCIPAFALILLVFLISRKRTPHPL